MSAEPRSVYKTLCEREIHVTEWGDPGKPALIMWHGLARTGRDFDPLAKALCEDYFILAPDTLGRGFSQWAVDAEREYSLEFYGNLAETLLEVYGLSSVRWVGTSMGGAIGMHVAGGSLRDRISHLVLNDIAPLVAEEAIRRIVAYASTPPVFETMAELEAFLRAVYKPYGFLPDSQWRQMTETSARRRDDGKLTVHYDPKMIVYLAPKEGAAIGDQWASYDAIKAKTMLYRGAVSDLVKPDWADEMTKRGPKAIRMDFEGVGHAPALNVPEQIEPIRAFLKS